jgi:hypothetical protein
MSNLEEFKKDLLEKQQGFAVPILLWLLGVPGVLVIVLWLVFWR